MHRSRRPPDPPLYDPRHEHDACGVGFVADAGGGSAGRVLPLALAGLASLGHRGAFAADGESSDGAGVSMPLEGAIRERIGATAVDDGPAPAVFQLFLPRGRAGSGRARGIVERAVDAEGLTIVRWRSVPTDPSALGRDAARSRPAFAQATVVARPDARHHARHQAREVGALEGAGAFDRAILRARRRIETAAREDGLADLSVPSASARTIVYKGLVAG
ncbi:MAG: class II glutamine amidotransferase domain-containing protein, partial [Candidatus Limnocylindrales bacterium]